MVKGEYVDRIGAAAWPCRRWSSYLRIALLGGSKVPHPDLLPPLSFSELYVLSGPRRVLFANFRGDEGPSLRPEHP